MILANGCNITKSEKFKGVWILSVPTVYIYIYNIAILHDSPPWYFFFFFFVNKKRKSDGVCTPKANSIICEYKDTNRHVSGAMQSERWDCNECAVFTSIAFFAQVENFNSSGKVAWHIVKQANRWRAWHSLYKTILIHASSVGGNALQVTRVT